MIVLLLTSLPCLWGILLCEISLSVNNQLSFHNPYDMFRLQTCQTNCVLQTKAAAIHFRVGSKLHDEHGRHALQQRKLMSCLLQPFFQVFIDKFVFASRPSRLLSYLSNMLCNNFCEHFQKLYDWLKNTVRLFSAFCVMLGKFIWVYLWFSCLRVKPYLYFVISKELKPEGKQITKKPEVI